jgi:biotin transport system permease protein
VSVGLYLPGDSPVHRVLASVKLLGLLGLGVAVLLVDSAPVLSGALGAVAALYGLARPRVREVLWALRPLALFLPLLFATHALLSSLEAALVAVLRLAVLLGSATLVTLTTRVSDMLEALERALRPLAVLGLRPARVSFMLALTVRFIPVLFAQLEEIREAQRARGLHHSPRAVLVPLLVKTLRMADALADALEARGYDPDPEPPERPS